MVHFVSDNRLSSTRGGMEVPMEAVILIGFAVLIVLALEAG